MGLPIYLTEFTFFGGTITQKSSKLPFSAEFSNFGKTESSLESVIVSNSGEQSRNSGE